MLRAFALIFCGLAAPLAFAQDEPDGDAAAAALDSQPPPPAKAVVASVYDGDTMTLSTGDKVRLRWVNTPELKPAEDYGVEAGAATRALVANQEVTLSYGAVTRDGYGRLIAGVKAGDQDLSLHLLELGLGHLFVIPPDDTDLSAMLAAQERARAAGRGIWSTERYKGALHITSFHANAKGDDRQNVNGEYLRVCNVSAAAVDLNGYRITDLSGRSWALPALVVPPGHTVKIISGKGEDQRDPQAQLEVYLQSADPVWNNERDRATIYDRYGRVVDTRAHEVKGSK
jgi:endonuclease YncB( thermonuclease family)